ncbi:unnamed protein product [Soboliphyme baturini]|uniref:Secreted protein n=1 Tax=Soboliphyme baturini TaxID=241478 RepID=A0A183J0F5_9BILA|nr:unnamed protein product [Soboliphyme baturini]
MVALRCCLTFISVLTTVWCTSTELSPIDALSFSLAPELTIQQSYAYEDESMSSSPEFCIPNIASAHLVDLLQTNPPPYGKRTICTCACFLLDSVLYSSNRRHRL